MIRRGLAVTLGVLLLAGLGEPVGAAPRDPVVGVGEQRPDVFDDRHFQRLGVRHVRYVVAWDALRFRWQRDEADAWMAKARAADARVVVAFNVSRIRARRHILPTPAQYRSAFQEFRRRYPLVRDYITWNEANHCSQPTCRRPDRVARYFDVARRACPRCAVVAADVLDTGAMAAWLTTFRRHATTRPRIWGLHNYLDANRFRSSGTRAMLAAVRGQIWFTETGGIVWRKRGPHTIGLGESRWHAARATRHVFRLARLSPRITRVYFYHWSFPTLVDKWDSAIIDRRGRPRPAYDVLRNHLRAAAERAGDERARAGS